MKIIKEIGIAFIFGCGAAFGWVVATYMLAFIFEKLEGFTR